MALLTVEDFRAILRHAIVRAGSQAAWARAHGLSRSDVSQHLSGSRVPSEKFVRVLGLRKVLAFEKIRAGSVREPTARSSRHQSPVARMQRPQILSQRVDARRVKGRKKRDWIVGL